MRSPAGFFFTLSGYGNNHYRDLFRRILKVIELHISCSI